MKILRRQKTGGEMSLKRAPVMFCPHSPSPRPREEPSLWESQTWEAKRTMTEHLEARGRAWDTLLPQSSRCGFCRKEQAWGLSWVLSKRTSQKDVETSVEKKGVECTQMPKGWGESQANTHSSASSRTKRTTETRAQQEALPETVHRLSFPFYPYARPSLMCQAQGILPWAKRERIPYSSWMWTWTCLIRVLVL